MASPNLRTSTAPPTSLMSLPLEVREKIYEQHLLDYSSYSSPTLHSSFSAKFPDEQIPLFTVSKQISTEISFIFQRKTPLLPPTYRITSQSATFDPYTRARFIARREPLNLGAVQHLHVEIYKPALPKGWKDEKTMKVEMARLWKRVRGFYLELRRHEQRLQTLTVSFPEAEWATWCRRNRKHSAYIRSCGRLRSHPRKTDVAFMLEILWLVRCEEMAEIRLPASVEEKFVAKGRGVGHSQRARRLKGVVEARMVRVEEGLGRTVESRDREVLSERTSAICGRILGERLGGRDWVTYWGG